MKKLTIYIIMIFLLVALASAKIHYINTNSDSISISIGNNDELYIDNENNKVGIGTTTIPREGVGISKLAIHGSVTDVNAGPHVMFMTDFGKSPVPLMQFLNWNHDNIGITFDGYYDGAWTSSDAGSNFRIYKYGDLLRFGYDSGITAGNAMTINDGMVITPDGNVGIGTTAPNSLLSVGGAGTSDATIYAGGNTYGLYGEGGNFGIYGDGTVVGVYGCDIDSCDTRYGLLGGASYGVYGQNYDSRYGYLGSSTIGAHGHYNDNNYASLGANSYGILAYGSQYGAYGGDSDTAGTNYGAYGYAIAGYGSNSGTRYGFYGLGDNASSYNYGIRGYISDAGALYNYAIYGYAYGGSSINYAIYNSGGTKNWANPHPYDPTLSIVYATIEGGENGAYWRGSANLTGGESIVVMPDHFEAATAPDYEVTVTATPKSAGSLGLAVVESNNSQFRVKELFNGTGSYEFDYVIVGKRRGYEEYEPIQTNMDYVPFQDNQGTMIDEKTSSQEFYDGHSENIKKIFKSSGILNEDGSINRNTFSQNNWVIFDHPTEEEAASIPDVIGPDGKIEIKWKITEGDAAPVILSRNDAEKLLEKHQGVLEKERND